MIFELEKAIKDPLFDCKHCGQCVLSHTALICPMTCPKGLRNGPCGGTLDGKCEVLPDQDCVWMNIDSRRDIDPETVHLPPDPELFNTASYVNYFTGRDRATRRPQPVIDHSHIPATSELAKTLYRGEFVVTFEIASPRTEAGLERVASIMERVSPYVDAVNTTTNAGGVPSLHSMETAKVVLAHGVEPIIQFCGRDQGTDALLAEVERAIGMGYSNFLLLTGDWLPQVERGVRQESWFPMDSLQMVHAVNAALPDFRDRLGVVPLIGVASNPFSTPMEVSVQRLHNKRHAGARFTQTQTITEVETYSRWYQELRRDREDEPRLTIPSVPLVGSRRAFDILCSLPGVYVDPSLHAILAQEDFQRPAMEWALDIAEGVTEHGAAGVHVTNFGMPLDLMDEFLATIRDRAAQGRSRSAYA